MVANNLIIIGVTFLTLFFMGVIVSMLYLKVIVPICELIGSLLASRMKSKYWLYILELFFFAIIGSFLYFSIVLNAFSGEPSELFIPYFFVYILLLLIETSTYKEYRRINNVSRTAGVIGWIINRTIWKSYIASRLILFIEQLVHTFYLIVPVYISLIFMTTLKWEDTDYYYSLLFVPIFMNTWVYIKISWKKYFFRLSFNSYQDIFMRRFLIYFLIIVYSLLEVYEKFNQYLDQSGKITFEYLFIYAAVVLYVALDRLLKEIVSDLNKFKRENTLNFGNEQLGTESSNNVFTHRMTSRLRRQKQKSRSRFRRNIRSTDGIANYSNGALEVLGRREQRNARRIRSCR